MKITSRNMAIMMILIFLIFNQFIGLAWEILKSLLYCILFLFLINQISPELYNYLSKIFNFKQFKFGNVSEFILDILKKVKTFIPFLNKSLNNKDNKEKL